MYFKMQLSPFSMAIPLLVTLLIQPTSTFAFQTPSVTSLPSSCSKHKNQRHRPLAQRPSLSSSSLGLSLSDFDISKADQLQLLPTDISISSLSSSLPLSVTNTFQEILSTISTTTNISPHTLIVTSLISTLTLTSLYTTFYILSHPPSNYRENAEPYLRGQYDPLLAQSYYKSKPLLVIRRMAQMFRLSNTFLFNILVDKYIFRRDEDDLINQKRAQELLVLIQEIGPTAIKVGQALSVRQDLINESYAKALVKLQDDVPPFDSDVAKEFLKNELGIAKFNRLKVEDNWEKPIASASIGQVYKATLVLNDDDEQDEEGLVLTGSGEGTTTNQPKEINIAIKIQRPNVLAEIALDLFIVREFIAPIYKRLTNTQSDLKSLANEWGRGFIAELSYDTEKYNTQQFNQQMKAKNLNAITAPIIIDNLSTNRVLTSQWVEGTRLDLSTANDIPRLCGVALNAYLVMLLETGVLHCDPHPGNLLRTTDGKLCILDFGMTLETPTDLQYSLLEFIAHLTAEDFESVPNDLVKLGFLKKEKLDLLVKTGALEPLYYFLRQANQGGGGSKVRERIYEEYRAKYPGVDDEGLQTFMRQEMKDSREKMAEKASAVTGVTMKVEDLQRENSDAFGIPEWFLYTSRAFLTLEGISLQADSDFSIVKSCFPYVAKRLLGDDSPRSQAALRNLIYGKDDELNTEKITELAEGFTKYTTTTKIVSQGGQGTTTIDHASSPTNGPSTEAALTLAKDSADILLASEGNLVQNLLVEESATALSANLKDTLREVLLSNPERLRSNLPLGIGNFLPKGPVDTVDKFLQKSKREEKVQLLVNKLSSFMSLPEAPTSSELSDFMRSMGNNESANAVSTMNPEEIAYVWKSIRENVPIYGPQVAALGGKVTTSVLAKVSENIDNVIASTEESQEVGDQLVRTSARGISAAAKGSANALKPLISSK